MERPLLPGDFSWPDVALSMPARLSQQSPIGHLSNQLVLKNRKRRFLQCGNPGRSNEKA